MFRRFILSSGILLSFTAATRGQTILAPIAKIVSVAKPFQFSISGSTTQITVVEATTNLQNWISIQTNAAGAGNVTVTDWYSHDYPKRFYRVRTLSTNSVVPTNPPPSDLSDLAQLNNSVFMAGEGFNTLQFAPNGKLGFIAWRGQDLIYRERNGGSWSEQIIGRFGSTYVPGVREEYRFQPHAALLFDSQSRAHILRLNGSSVAHHLQQSNGTFADDAAISLSGIGSSFSLFTTAIGPNDKLHIAVVGSGTSPALNYGSNKSGSWQWRQVTTISGNSRGFLAQSYAPRWFSMAIDSQNNAHVAFCPQFAMPAYDGHARPYSELHYASDRGGNWFTQKVSSTSDDSGDVGAGASIAIGPDDLPAIANWFNDRASTGSSQYNQLHYQKRDSSGNWTKQFVTGNSAGYQAGDGPKGAGFAPYLRFDSRGRPNIAFCDDASQHFSDTGQNEYAGDLRHAYFNGSQWVFQIIYQQTVALDRQAVYPAMATAGNEIVFMGLNRQTAWASSRDAISTYNWFYVQTALP
ncbi:MAG: hypothetical protein ABIR24_05560 [Verrucomicrobiota bacterium]